MSTYEKDLRVIEAAENADQYFQSDARIHRFRERFDYDKCRELVEENQRLRDAEEENRKLKRDNKRLREMLAEFIKQYAPVLEEDMPEHHDRVVVMAFQDMHEEAKELLR